MFKKRSLLSFRRPKSISGPPSHYKSRTLVLTPPLSAGFVTPEEHPLETHDNKIHTEPLFHEDYITPTEEKRSNDDLFVEALSARNPEVDYFISDMQPPGDPSSVQVEDLDDDDFENLAMECVTIDEVGVSYPSGSARLIDHDPWRYSGLPRPEESDGESQPLKIPPRSPYRSRFDPPSSSGSDSISYSDSSSSSPYMPSTPESSAWPLPSGDKISSSLREEAEVVRA